MFYQELLNPLGILQRGRRGHSLGGSCYRAGDETWELGFEAKREREDLKTDFLLSCPVCFPDQCGLLVPRECLWEMVP